MSRVLWGHKEPRLEVGEGERRLWMGTSLAKFMMYMVRHMQGTENESFLLPAFWSFPGVALELALHDVNSCPGHPSSFSSLSLPGASATEKYFASVHLFSSSAAAWFRPLISSLDNGETSPSGSPGPCLYPTSSYPSLSCTLLRSSKKAGLTPLSFFNLPLDPSQILGSHAHKAACLPTPPPFLPRQLLGIVIWNFFLTDATLLIKQRMDDDVEKEKSLLGI